MGSPAVLSSIGKRKAENQLLEEDAGDSGTTGDCDGEEGGSSSPQPTAPSPENCESLNGGYDDSKEWEWGYDSYEDPQWESCMKHIYQTKDETDSGFLITTPQFGGIYPLSDAYIDEPLPLPYPPITLRQHLIDVAKQAVEKYNEINGTVVKFVNLKRVNAWYSCKAQYYVTILAREKPDGPLVDYQVKVQRRIRGEFKPIFCRPYPSK